jgi:hypothetical protein
MMKAKYKSVAKKVIPISAYDLHSIVPEYKQIEIGKPSPLPMEPHKLNNLVYTKKLTKECMDTIIGNILNGFLSKDELELILHVIFEYEDAFAFTDEE